MTSLLAATPPGFAPAIAILVAVVASDVWVYNDATRQRDIGEPVVLVVGSARIDTPEAWLVVCVFLWLIAFPPYLVGRRR